LRARSGQLSAHIIEVLAASPPDAAVQRVRRSANLASLSVLLDDPISVGPPGNGTFFGGLTVGRPGIEPASVLTRALAVVAACAVLLAGCNGGTVDRHALTNDAASVDSMACEGALLAHDVVQGKTTVYFVREQAEALRIQSSNLANALAKRKALASIEQRARAKSKDAAKLSTTLQRLRDHPSDRGVAASVEQQLKKLGGCR
jgi:hypothetical protein